MNIESVANLKFLYCKIKNSSNIDEISIDDFKNYEHGYKESVKELMFCPDCEVAKITYVNAATPYFRTRRSSLHSETCGKAVKSTIKNTDEVNDTTVENFLVRILEKEAFQNHNSREKHKTKSRQKSLSRYKSKSLNTITDQDIGLYYCYYARNVKIVLNEKYLTYNFLRIFKASEINHFISIKIKKEFFPNMTYNINGLYDIAFFGKFDVNHNHKDVTIDNPKFIRIK